MRTHLLPGHEAGKVGEYAILVRARNVIPPCATYAAIFAHVSVAHVRTYVRTYVRLYVRMYERTKVRTYVYQSRAFVITFFCYTIVRTRVTYVRLSLLNRNDGQPCGPAHKTHTQIS